ncbi:MAG: efflux RND transporter periplasmic adaptor subunit [Bacteroidales bacterium]|nr:efflux RND transporter periplasmic adaptor subunit [Bacteroidales bacterium]
MKKLKLLLPLALVALAVSCGTQAGKEKAPAKYRTITVSLSDQTLESKYAATLEGQQLVEIRPQVSGTITKICFNEGDKVRKGQTLFILDQVPYQAAVEVADANVKSAEAQLATARLTAESNQMLFDKEVISAYELQTARNALASAEAAYAQAKAQVTTAHNNLSYTVVKSPVDGVAGMIPYRVGALVSSSIASPLVTVSDDNFIYAYFSLNENQILELMRQFGSQERFLKEMPPVALVMSTGDRLPESGKIDAVSGIIDQSTGAVRMRARFDNSAHLMRSGGSATVIIPTHRTDCIVIPQTSTFEIQEKVFVQKVVEGKTKSTPVRVFRLNDGASYVVESGLNPGDVIIAEGAGLVKEGTAIITQEEEQK